MNLIKKTLRIYQDCNGREPFSDWIGTLTAGDRARVLVRLDRVETGNPGDHRSVGEDVYEFRFIFGSGYRVYYGEVDNTLVLLLCGGDKSSQKKDVKKAKAYWRDYISRRTV
jgi:putative addiction module killer protein